MIAGFRLHIFIFIILSLLSSVAAFAAPSISSISPTAGPVSPIGSAITITGSGFGAAQGTNSITVGGVPSAPTSWSDTRIIAPVPSSLLPGFADVVVTVAGVSSNAQSFLVIPVITLISPASGTVGNSVTITGTSFGDQQNDSTLAFDGIAATPSSWSNTSITANVPDTFGSVSVVVTVNGFSTNGAGFDVHPNIIAITPSAASAGSQVTISGTAFGPTQVFGGVTFNGVSAQITSWSDTTIVATVPDGATTGNVIVTGSSLLGSAGVAFTVTPSLAMATSRYLHSATLLNNGMVLVAGGISCSAPNACTYLNSAEVYNPSAGTFVATGSMAVARSAPSVLLPNGQVLIAGGYSCDSGGNCTSLDSAELYDPASGTFSSAGNMNTPRSEHTMTLLKNGEVLITGGRTCASASACVALGSVELFDPISKTFFPSSSELAFPRFGAAATALPDGNVLIVGGFDGANLTSQSEIYFSDFDFFEATGSLHTARYQPTATLLNSGKVFIVGGSNCALPDTCPTDSAELFNETAGTFTAATATMASSHFNHSGTLLGNGQVLIAGGFSSCATACTSTSGTELFDPAAGTFASGQSLASARAGETATLLQNGNVLLAGGINDGITLFSGEIYQPASLSPAILSSIAITPANRSFLPGETLQLLATGTFSGETTQTLQSVTWSSSDNTVATITDDASDRGIAYAVANGTVTVNACAGSICGSTTLRVGPPIISSIAITPATSAVPLGIPQKFAATGTFSDGTTQDVSGTVTWTSANTQIATVSSIGLANGISVGSTTIQAASGSINSSASITVQPPVLISLTVHPALGGTIVSGTEQFSVNGSFSDGSTQDVTASASWTSNNTGVATINGSGLASGAGPGSATIQAHVGSATASASLNVTSAVTPPAITAAVSPAPNANGWNNASATVTFTCTAGSSAIASCSGPQTGSSEGISQQITGTVTDVAGNSSSVSVQLNIDKTAPSISVASPLDDANSTTSTITVTGEVSDALSGVGSLACNGVTVTTSGGAFSCDVTLNPGANIVRITSTDVAGNVATVNLHATFLQSLPPPSALAITPGTTSMLVDDDQSFSAMDEQGRVRTDATWSISDTSIATLDSTSPGTLTAVSPGQVTLTASLGGISATTTVTVFPGTILPAGTITWAFPQVPASSVKQVVRAAPVEGAPGLYSVEQEGSGVVNVRALTITGQQLWAAQVNGNSANVTAVPDNDGGLLLDFSGAGSKLVRLDGKTGITLWQYQYTSAADGGRKLAVGYDGKIYFREVQFVPDPVILGFTDLVWSLISLDVETGSRASLYTVEQSTLQDTNLCTGNTQKFTHPFTSSGLSNPSLLPDGSVVASTVVTHEIDAGDCSGNNRVLDPGVSLTLLKGQSSIGAIPFRSLASVLSDGSSPTAVLQDVIPDGQGGTFVAWSLLSTSSRNQTLETHVSDVSDSGSSDFTVPFAAFNPVTMVLGDQGSLVVTNELQAVSLDSSHNTQWQWVPGQGSIQIISGNAGGGATFLQTLDSGEQNVVNVDSTGSAQDSTWGGATGSSGFGVITSPTYSTNGLWVGVTSQSLAQLQGDSLPVASNIWSLSRGNPGGNGVPGEIIFDGTDPLWAIAAKATTKVPKCAQHDPKTALSGKGLQRFNDKQEKLFSGSYLRSAACQQFFSDPKRSAYFSLLTQAVENVVSYDGSKSAITPFDAGAWTPADLQTFGEDKMKQTYISCIMDSDATGTVAIAQIQPPQGGSASDVYFNTHMLNKLSQATILHEALHNLTGKNDPDLKTMLDIKLGSTATDDINHKLEDNGCAGTN